MSQFKFTDAKDRPSRTKNPLAWERSWERDFKRIYSSNAYTHGSFSDMCSSEMVHMFASDFSLVLIAQNKQQLRAQQRRFTSRAAEACALFDFEKIWRETPGLQRDDILLQVICRVFTSRDMDVERIWCPDSTLSHLSSNNGETFLTVMKQLFVEGDAALHKEAEPRYVPHPILDRICALTEAERSKPGYRAFATYVKISRARILTEIILGAVNTLYGVEDHEPVRESLKFCSNKAALASMESLPAEVYKLVSDVVQRSESSDHKSPSHYACWTCGERAKARQKMQVCAACKKISRTVTYCSRECQTRDWKMGTHKSICGKPLTEDALQTVQIGASALPPNFELPPPTYPDPDPSFTHSPALLYQVQWLRRLIAAPDYPSYAIFRPDKVETPSRLLWVIFPDWEMKVLFIIHRNRALRTGDPHAVRTMWAILVDWLADLDPSPASPAHVRAQLEAEYGVKLEPEGLLDALESIQDTVMPGKDSEEFMYLKRAMGGALVSLR